MTADRLTTGDIEHLGSIAGGLVLTVYGLKKRSWPGLILTGLGGALLYRGLVGYRRLYDLLGIPIADVPTRKVHELITVERSVVVGKSAEELYRFWRNFENLPRFMANLEDVMVLDERRSHWVARAPAGLVVEWEADIVNDVPNHIIAWKSREGFDVDTAGSVNFREVEGGTEVTVRLRYLPPGEHLGHGVAKFFHLDPATQLEDDLQRLKHAIESGEAAAS
ncbi:MAG TPA: SRPBCC family protein [Fimbriimonadaceae bacterium]|nr:SRPBCC family protein [Fimbriimonadaceae bacterium]